MSHVIFQCSYILPHFTFLNYSSTIFLSLLPSFDIFFQPISLFSSSCKIICISTSGKLESLWLSMHQSPGSIPMGTGGISNCITSWTFFNLLQASYFLYEIHFQGTFFSRAFMKRSWFSWIKRKVIKSLFWWFYTSGANDRLVFLTLWITHWLLRGRKRASPVWAILTQMGKHLWKIVDIK